MLVCPPRFNFFNTIFFVLARERCGGARSKGARSVKVAAGTCVSTKTDLLCPV